MAAKLILCTGPSGSGKTTHLLARYRKVLAAGSPGQGLWLVPTYRYGQAIRDRLLDGPLAACFSPGLMTFDQFAESVLRHARTSIRPLTRLMKRQLLGHVVEDGLESNRVRYFASIAGSEGLIDLLESFIAELKRREIWPEHLAEIFAAQPTPRRGELLWIYRQYQRHLHDQQLYDAEGRFWTARALLREGQFRPFEQLRVIVADGFTDFTTTQHEILRLLGERVDEIHVSLPLGESEGRESLFRKPRQTLQLLKQSFQRVQELKFSPPKDALPAALQHLESELFKAPLRHRSNRDCVSITRVETAGQTREIEWLAREIKQLLLDGDSRASGTKVRPEEILVVIRSLKTAASLICEVFDRFGIPFVIEEAKPLSRFPAVTAILSYLRLKVEDWPYRQVLAALGSSFYQSALEPVAAGNALAASQRTIHRLQLPDGCDELLRRVRWWTNQRRDEPGPDTENYLGWRNPRQKWIDDAQQALPMLEELAERLRKLPENATPSGWADALAAFANSIGFLRAAEAERDGSHAAWQRVLDALRQHEWLALRIAETPPVLSASETLHLVTEIVTGEALADHIDSAGRVQVLSAASSRNLRFKYVFFAGLTEDSFPKRREEPLLAEADLERLRAGGVELAIGDQRDDEEMLLFYEVVTRADRQLYLSFAALDDAAERLLPSPYLGEVTQLFAEKAVLLLNETDPRPLFGSDNPLCASDARIGAVAQASQGETERLRDLVHQPQSAIGANLLAGLKTTAARGTDTFGNYEGLLSSDRVRPKLEHRFGSSRTWSSTLLEQYATCPFQFFAERVLHVEPLPEVVLDLNAAERGRWLHQALASVHRRLNAEGARPRKLSPDDAPLIEDYFNEALSSLASSGEEPSRLAAALRTITAEILRRWSAQYPDQHAKYDASLQKLAVRPLPTHFEVSFGLPPQSDGDPLATDKPLELTLNGDSIRIWGRIDRIDVALHGTQRLFNVIDYKSGRLPATKVDPPIDGTSLQLDLYVMAAQRLLFQNQGVPARGGYWSVRDTGFKLVLDMCEAGDDGPQPSTRWAKRCAEVTEKVFELVNGIRGGAFPVNSRDQECTSYCPYRTACRVNQIRALNKKWPPQATPAQ